MDSVAMFVVGMFLTSGGIAGGVALAATMGPCGEVDDQCAMNAILLGPAIGSVFIGLPMMISGGSQVPIASDADGDGGEDEDDDFAIQLGPGRLGATLRF